MNEQHIPPEENKKLNTKPDDLSALNVEDCVKIFDPETKKVIVHKRN